MAKAPEYLNDDPKKPIWGRNEKGTAICAAHKRGTDGQEICQKPAGYGTKHNGWGRCKWHGGNAGVGVGNTNSVKHGLYSKRVQSGDPLWLHLLPHEVRTNWDTVKVNTLDQLNNEIKLCDARIYMLQNRINELEELEFVTTEVNMEEGTANTDGGVVPTEKTVTKTENAGIHITKLEDAITKVQGVKQKALDLKFRIECTDLGEDGGDNIATLSKALEQSARFLKARKPYTPDKINEGDDE